MSEEALDLQEKVVVAMSGGVDSSVAALLLHQQGYPVVGVSMQVWDYRNHGGQSSKATCCAPDDFTDARKVAASIGVPYYVVDFEKSFRREVIDKFVATYQRGETPNPCVDCNNQVKFRELRERAFSFGCSSVATGHFAQIEERDDGFHLIRGVDSNKDQTYFLYGIQQEELKNTLFPVGGYTKSQVRELAEQAGLTTANKPESQDICFVSGSVKEFLVKIGKKSSTGAILDRNGQQIGEHDGISNFTVGQRRGIGVGGTEIPLYVLELDAKNNAVIVGAREDLERESFTVSEVNWVSPEYGPSKTKSFKAMAQLRHRHQGVLVQVELLEDGRMECSFLEDWSIVSPGQAAVLYDLDNRELLAGGRIQRFN